MTETREDFLAEDGTRIAVRRFSSEMDRPRAVLIVLHGMSEHSGRYARLAAYLSPAGIETWAPDHRGHGLSAADPAHLGFMGARGGLFLAMSDAEELTRRINALRPGLPVFLMGHSMGSFIVQGIMARRGGEYAGAILSGTAGPGNPLVGLGVPLGRLVSALRGPAARSPFLHAMAVGSYNRAFRPARTPYDWLSRDQNEVDAFMRDPLCAFICPVSFYLSLAECLSWIHRPATMAAIPRGLPVYLFSGSMDPVGAAPGYLNRLVEAYRRQGMDDVQLRVYPGARHECLNETNRGQVMAELLAWLEDHLGGRKTD